MAAAVERAVADGFTHVAFGDLFLEDIRRYREERLAGHGARRRSSRCSARTRRRSRARWWPADLRARLTCVNPKELDRRFAGREFDAALLDELPASIDPCGERGEFHSFAYAGPMFCAADSDRSPARSSSATASCSRTSSHVRNDQMTDR